MRLVGRWRRDVKRLRRTSLLGCLLAFVALAVRPSPIAADTVSRTAYARGLIAFHEARWSEALAAFERAVQADPKGARARYYRGLTYARLGDSHRAVEDIAAALQLEPSLPHAPLDLGIAHLSLEQWREAESALLQAYRAGQERLVAAFFLGVALYKQGRAEEALRYFQEAQADPEVRPAAAYYAGLIELAQKRSEQGRSLLGTVVRELPDSEIGMAAQRYLAMGEAALTPWQRGKPWWVHGGVAFEYDSNVSIGPSDQPPSVAADVSEKSDGRSVLSAGAGYSLLQQRDWVATLGYSFSQSVHFDLTRFDLQGHRLGGELSWHQPQWSAGLGAGYAFYALNYQSFFHEGLVTPYLTWRPHEAAATQAFLAFRGRDFLRKPYDPGRDARNYAPGVRQYLNLGRADRVLMLGYQFEIEDTVSDGPQGRTFDYHAHELRAEFAWAISEPLQLQAGYAYRAYSYENRESGFGARKRSDDAHEFALAARYRLSDHLALVGSYIGQMHDSNVGVFEYDRYILSAGLQAVY